MKLSDNFYLEEFLTSETAERKGIDNTPPGYVVENLKYVAKQMEEVRKLLGNNAIIITSGYRSPALNKEIGSKDTSQHLAGEAVDFKCNKFGTPDDIVKAIISSGIVYDQLIKEFDKWVHISFKAPNRKQALIIDSAGTRLYS